VGFAATGSIIELSEATGRELRAADRFSGNGGGWMTSIL
jgi:hypothetical protein